STKKASGAASADASASLGTTRSTPPIPESFQHQLVQEAQFAKRADARDAANLDAALTPTERAKLRAEQHAFYGTSDLPRGPVAPKSKLDMLVSKEPALPAPSQEEPSREAPLRGLQSDAASNPSPAGRRYPGATAAVSIG